MKANTVLPLIMATVIVLVGTVLVSPGIERKHDVIVLDAAITETCWQRHGFDLFSRWSCRSSLHRIGPIGLALGCGRDSRSDLCANLERLGDEQRRRSQTEVRYDRQTY
jgi:hypothetical protein